MGWDLARLDLLRTRRWGERTPRRGGRQESGKTRIGGILLGSESSSRFSFSMTIFLKVFMDTSRELGLEEKQGTSLKDRVLLFNVSILVL